MPNWTEINDSFSQRMDTWTETPIAWDNTDFTPKKGVEWIRCILLPLPTENSNLGKSKMHYGIFWIQIFVPENTGSGRAYELAEMLDAMFSNVQFDDIVCYASDVQRDGDDGYGWYQTNVRVNYWAHERN